MLDSNQAITVAARRTGLSAHVIRIWEKRYSAVVPERTGSNRRVYSEEQIERLILLRDLTALGHGIGQIARLPTEMLREMMEREGGRAAVAVTRAPGSDPAAELLAESIAAVQALNARQLEDAMQRGAIALGSQGLLQKIIAPLAQAIGELWRDGTITAAHEHFATAIIRLFLGHAAKPFAGSDSAPVLVVATPAGQLHELGALLAGALAANLGWHITYLGASLPAVEIAAAARQTRARAVALSVVYPEDDPRLPNEFDHLRKLLPAETALLVGGRAAPSYGAILNRIGATTLSDLTQLGRALDKLRQG